MKAGASLPFGAKRVWRNALVEGVGFLLAFHAAWDETPASSRGADRGGASISAHTSPPTSNRREADNDQFSAKRKVVALWRWSVL